MSGDSAVSGQLFGRQAFVGISSDTYGTLTFGRHTSFMLDNIGGYDPVQGAQFFSPLGYSGSYGGGGMTDDSRIDNSVKYKVKVGGFNIGLLTKFSGVAGSSSAQSAFQANVGYEAGPLGIQGSIQSNKDAFSLANPNGTTQPMGTVVATPQDTSSYLVVARYKISAFTIKAGYEYMKFSNPSNPYEDAGVTSLYGTTVSIATTTPYTLTSGPASGQEIDKTLKVYWVGADWNITPQFNIALGYYHVDQNDYSGNPAVASSKSAGTGKYTSLLLDYHFTKKFDAYAGYMSNTNADGMAFGYLHDSNSITGLGLRYSF
jgi:predicted porin